LCVIDIGPSQLGAKDAQSLTAIGYKP
jgi:hypothetical protein